MSNERKPEIFEYERLKVILTQGDDGFTVAWHGECDARKPDPLLDGFLQSLVRKVAGRRSIIDFTNLEFMNSSTLSSILNFIRQLDTQCQAKILYNAKIEWQLVAYRCMKAISRTLKQTEVINIAA
jgi:hypothetical protein